MQGPISCDRCNALYSNFKKILDHRALTTLNAPEYLQMRISEIYCSNQGEGELAGTPSIFIRTSGCNLRCVFCDTPFASWTPEGPQMTIDTIVNQVLDLAAKPDRINHVVVTGGEPMLPAEIKMLCRTLKQHQFHITIETAGTIDRDVPCDLMSISPKMSNSDPSIEATGAWTEKHQRTRRRPNVVSALISRTNYQIKFVVTSPDDLPEILEFLQDTPSIENKKVLLMPEGVSEDELLAKEDWLKPICTNHGFKFCQRQHIFWYGNRRGT